MIVTTARGRYRVEETPRGWFEFTLLAGEWKTVMEDEEDALAVWVPPGFVTVHRGPLRLEVGPGLCFDADAVQLVECDCNRITALEP
jgi:hypothetical protein